MTMYDSYIVKRTQIYLDSDQDEQLGRRARAEGTTRSALIRRAVDRYLQGEEDRTLPLARFHRALRDASGVAPYLGDGAGYVEGLRGADREREQELEARRRS
jgi:Ribbon-helix-helix protein, copG family